MDVTLLGTCSHVIIMTWKVDPHAEGGARILIKESYINMTNNPALKRESKELAKSNKYWP